MSSDGTGPPSPGSCPSSTPRGSSSRPSGPSRTPWAWAVWVAAMDTRDLQALTDDQKVRATTHARVGGPPLLLLATQCHDVWHDVCQYVCGLVGVAGECTHGSRVFAHVSACTQGYALQVRARVCAGLPKALAHACL